MESERAQNFNDRLNQWVAGQGFWFQLKYSMAGRGMNGAGGYQLLRMGMRLSVFLLLVGAGWVIYLTQRTETQSFRKDLEKSMLEEMGAKEGKLEGFQRVQGKLSMARFAAVGNDGTFYTDLDARNISARMGVFDGVLTQWKPGTVFVSHLDIDLRAGTMDASQAESLGEVLFKNRPNLEIEAIDIEESTVTWGYSDATRGMIENSKLQVRKETSGWRFHFRGGKFSQNWLKGLEIEDLVAVCNSTGVVFERAMFRKGGGTVDLTGLKITGKDRPKIAGTAKMLHVPLEGMLPGPVGNLLEGKISGNLKVSGSTNDTAGVGFEGKIELGDGDEVSLRDRVHLLKAMRVVDVFNNYRRVNFRVGSFGLKSGAGELSVSNVDLKAEDLLTLNGNMKVRPPTAAEIQARSGGMVETRSLIFSEPDETGTDSTPSTSDFTLKRAGKESVRKDQTRLDDAMDRSAARLEDRRFAAEIADGKAAALQYEGSLEMTLRADAFSKTDKLKAVYPVDQKTGRTFLKVPLEGHLGILTLKQAEDIYDKSKR